MIDIPRKMSNEHSRLVAGVLIAEREKALYDAKLYGATNRLNKFLSGSLIKD